MKKIIAIFLAATLILGLCGNGLAVLALEVDMESTNGWSYVSLGDSMTNGMGMNDGYDSSGHNGYMEVAQKGYPNLLAKKYGWNLTQLATSGMRVEDLHYILEYDYEAHRAENFSYTYNGKHYAPGDYKGDGWTYDKVVDYSSRWGNVGVDNVAENYQNSVAKADIITNATGNGNFGVFLGERMGEAMEALNSGADMGNWNVEYVLSQSNLDESYKDLIRQICDAVLTYAKTVMAEDVAEVVTETLGYTLFSYMINYAGAVEAVLELNPDVNYVVMGLINTMDGMKMSVTYEQEEQIIDFGDIFALVVDPMNFYMASLPVMWQKEGKYPQANFYFVETDHVETFSLEFGMGTPNAQIRDRIFSGTQNDLFGMLKEQFPGLETLTHKQVLELEAVIAMENDGERALAMAAYVQTNGEEIASAAAFYLALEEAILKSANTVSPLSSVKDVMNVTPELFAGVLEQYTLKLNADSFKAGNEEYDATYAALWPVAEETACVGLLARLAESAAAYGVIRHAIPATGSSAAKVAALKAHLKNPDDCTACIFFGPETVQNVYHTIFVSGEGKDDACYYDRAMVAAKEDLNDTVVAFMTLSHTPEVMTEAMLSKEANITALLNFYCRLRMANGLASHLGAMGHNTVFEAVVKTLEEDITCSDAVTQKIIVAMKGIYTVMEKYGPVINDYLQEGERPDREYMLHEESYYVALGDQTAVSSSYADLLAKELGLEGEYTNLAQDGMTAAQMEAVLAENAEIIAKADLITLGFGANTFLNFAVDQIKNALMGRPVQELDWETYITAEGAAEVEAVMAQLRDSLAQSLGAGMEKYANAMAIAVESYLHAYTTHMLSYSMVVDAIHEINPEALLVLVGMHNPMEGVVMDMDGSQLALGEYLSYLVDATNTYMMGYALMNPKTIYAEAGEAEVANQKTEVSAVQFIMSLVFDGTEDFELTQNGQSYISGQVMDTLIFVEEKEILLGDVNGDEKINSLDASLIMQYKAELLGEEQVICEECADVNGDGKVNSLDASLIMQLKAGLIEQFPAA